MAEGGGKVIGCHTVESWKEQIQRGMDLKKLTAAEAWEVEAMPTSIFLKEGKLVDKIVGVWKEELHAKVVEHAAVVTASA